MPARKKETNINLLPQTGITGTTSGRVLTWVLSSFRIIVIATEIIVMIAFLSRFWLDAQNSDLIEELETKKAALIASASFENEFRQTQKRVKIFSGLTNEDLSNSTIIKNVTEYLPENAFLSSVTKEDKGITIRGDALNEVDIQQYLVNLQTNDNFKDIAITQISTKDNNPLFMEFELYINLAANDAELAIDEGA